MSLIHSDTGEPILSNAQNGSISSTNQSQEHAEVMEADPAELSSSSDPQNLDKKKKKDLFKVLMDVFRPLRWYRNGFMLAAVVLAIKILNIDLKTIFSVSFIYPVLISFVALCLVASGNYGINEVLDAETIPGS